MAGAHNDLLLSVAIALWCAQRLGEYAKGAAARRGVRDQGSEVREKQPVAARQQA
jgi:hypothetical protein